MTGDSASSGFGEDWTTCALGTLGPYLLPQFEDGKVEFFGVPPAVAAALVMALSKLPCDRRSAMVCERLRGVLSVGELFAGADVRYQGFISTHPRKDACVVITAFTVDLEYAPAVHFSRLRELGDAVVLIDNQTDPARLLIRP